MKTEFSELNNKLEKIEGSILENLDKIEPLDFSELANGAEALDSTVVEYSSCGCYVSCGSEYSRNGKCSCYTSCGSNYSRG